MDHWTLYGIGMFSDLWARWSPSLSEYVQALAKSGWKALGSVLVSWVPQVLIWSGFGIPTWIGLASVAIGLVIFPFVAFHGLRIRRDELAAERDSLRTALETRTPAQLRIEFVKRIDALDAEIEASEDHADQFLFDRMTTKIPELLREHLTRVSSDARIGEFVELAGKVRHEAQTVREGFWFEVARRLHRFLHEVRRLTVDGDLRYRKSP